MHWKPVGVSIIDLKAGLPQTRFAKQLRCPREQLRHPNASCFHFAMIRPILILFLSISATTCGYAEHTRRQTAQERTGRVATVTGADLLALPIRGTVPVNNRPVVFGRTGDGYPDSLVVKGIVEDAYPASFCSGILPTSGTIAVRLDGLINVDRPMIYVALRCFAGPDAEEWVVGRRIEVLAYKLYEDTDGFGIIWNGFELGSQPLYGADSDWQDHVATK